MEDVEEGVTPTGNQQPQPRDLTPKRSRLAIRGIRFQEREAKVNSKEWGKLRIMMSENPPKRCRGESENGRESDCRNRKRHRNKIDTLYSIYYADSEQQDGNQEVEKGARDVGGFQRSSRESEFLLTHLMRLFRDKTC